MKTTGAALIIVALIGGAAELASSQPAEILGKKSSDVLELRRDVLILRAGAREEGELAGCSATSCSIRGRPYRRNEIFMVGLSITSADLPPLIEDPSQDSIQLRNGGLVRARLLGVNAQAVVTAQGSNQRAEVSWIYLAPAQPDSPDADGPDKQAKTDKDKAKPADGEAQPAATRKDPKPLTDERWIGEVYWTWKASPQHRIVSIATVRLRVGNAEISNLVHDGTTIHVRHETFGGDCIYRGAGMSEAEGEAGFIVAPRDARISNGNRINDPWTYSLFFTPARDPKWTVTCDGVDGPVTFTHGGGSGYSPLSIGSNDDPEIPRVLDMTSGRMEGSYRLGGEFEKTARWSICREGVKCPPVERDDPAPSRAAKCAAPHSLRAKLDLALAQQNALQSKTDLKSLNDLRNVSTQVELLLKQYSSACLDYAKCMGMPLSLCEPLQTATASPKGSKAKAPPSAPPSGGGFTPR